MSESILRRIERTQAFLALTTTILIACGGRQDRSVVSAAPQSGSLAGANVAPATPMQANGLASGSAASQTPLVTDEQTSNMNRFALELWAQSILKDAARNNAALSPLSVMTALEMTAQGARGPTRTEMLQTLRAVQGRTAARALTQRLTHASGATFRAANGVFVDQMSALQQAFLQTVASEFQARAMSLDFSHQPEPSRGEINRWVDEATSHRIPQLLGPGTITSQTAVVLTNAVYFRGAWQDGFDIQRTRPEPFQRLDGSTSNVAMMHRTGDVAYATNAFGAAIALPYRGDGVDMAVVVPHDFIAFEQGLSDHANACLQLLASLSMQPEVRISLPRFAVRGASRSLAQALQDLGMHRAFSDADFGGMLAGGTSISISDVIHQAEVETNEEGTVASAATAVIMVRGMPGPGTSFAADKPFYFFIRDRPTGAILFMGRVTEIAN